MNEKVYNQFKKNFSIIGKNFEYISSKKINLDIILEPSKAVAIIISSKKKINKMVDFLDTKNLKIDECSVFFKKDKKDTEKKKVFYDLSNIYKILEILALLEEKVMAGRLKGTPILILGKKNTFFITSPLIEQEITKITEIDIKYNEMTIFEKLSDVLKRNKGARDIEIGHWIDGDYISFKNKSGFGSESLEYIFSYWGLKWQDWVHRWKWCDNEFILFLKKGSRDKMKDCSHDFSKTYGWEYLICPACGKMQVK